MLFYKYADKIGIVIKKINIKYYIAVITVIYLLVIALLIYMHFGMNRQFFETHLNITLSGTAKTSTTQGKNVSSLDVIFFGIKLRFSDAMPLTIESSNGLMSNLFIMEYHKNRNSIDLIFTNGFKINISGDAENGFLIQSGSRLNGEITRIILSFDTDGHGTLLSSSNFPIFGYRNNNDSLHFLTALGNDSTIDVKQKEISLFPDSDDVFKIAVLKAKEGLNDPNTFWLAKNKPDILQRSIDEDTTEQMFAENAFRVWRIDRLNRNNGTWLNKNRQYVYSKEVVSALASEVIRRRSVSINQWIFRLGERNTSIRYLETALVNGNLLAAYTQSQERDIELMQEITSRIRREDASIFLFNDLVNTITNSGPFYLLQELFLLAEKFDIESSDIKTAIGVASAYLDFAIINMEREVSLERFNTIVDTIILNRLILNENGLFIAITGDRSESLYTARIAALFIKAASITERPILERIGSKLMHSIILLMDSAGFSPEYIYADRKSIKNTEGRIEPEYLYPALSIARYMPTVKSLINYFSPGTWIATCASSINIVKPDNTRVTLETTFPAGETEYIIIHGIPRVSRVLLYGDNWEPSANFEWSNTGWTYNTEAQALFIKLQHRQEKETIEIFF